MKIEKVNENQIRCTLTKEDLASRQLKISELAYGTEKAKNLFRDMMQQANFEFGFEAEDIPLMIEAIPLNSECIVLIITKVEDPEELDTRFSRFAPSVTDEADDEDDEYDSEPPSDEILDLFRRLQDNNDNSSVGSNRNDYKQNNQDKDTSTLQSQEENLVRVFRMDSLQHVMNAASVVGTYYTGFSTLYKEPSTSKYLLVLTKGTADKNIFDRVCFCLSEYGSMLRSNPSSLTFMEEHHDVLIADTALQSLMLKH